MIWHFLCESDHLTRNSGIRFSDFFLVSHWFESRGLLFLELSCNYILVKMLLLLFSLTVTVGNRLLWLNIDVLAFVFWFRSPAANMNIIFNASLNGRYLSPLRCFLGKHVCSTELMTHLGIINLIWFLFRSQRSKECPICWQILVLKDPARYLWKQVLFLFLSILQLCWRVWVNGRICFWF